MHVRSGAGQRGARRTVSRGRDDDLPRWHPRRRAQTIATRDRPRTSVEDCTSGAAKRRHAWRQPRGCSGTGSGDGAGATVKSRGGSAGRGGRRGGGNSCGRDGSSCTDGGRINGGGGHPGSQGARGAGDAPAQRPWRRAYPGGSASGGSANTPAQRRRSRVSSCTLNHGEGGLSGNANVLCGSTRTTGRHTGKAGKAAHVNRVRTCTYRGCGSSIVPNAAAPAGSVRHRRLQPSERHQWAYSPTCACTGGAPVGGADS